MGLFGKKSDSESQKEQLRDNIQYNDREPVTEVICCHATEMDNKTFVWKYPGHHFNTMSQLIVNESQEAIFFLNGEALDSFGPGRYTLETQNIPKLSKIIYGSKTGGAVPFQSEVYFVNLTDQMAILWGTDSKVEYIEPQYKFPVKVGACGEMILRVIDPRKLLIKLVGTDALLTQAGLVSYFKSILMTKVKSYIAQVLSSRKISIFEIDSHLDVFSEELKERLKGDFEEYGMGLVRFLVTTVQKPDGDALYDKFRELSYRQVIEVEDAKIRQQVGIINAQTKAQNEIDKNITRACYGISNRIYMCNGDNSYKWMAKKS